MDFIRLHQSSILLGLSCICFAILLFLLVTTYLPKRKRKALLFFTFSNALMLLAARYSYVYQNQSFDSAYFLAPFWKYIMFMNVLNVSYGFNEFLICLYKENHEKDKTPKVFNIIRGILFIGHILLIINLFTGIYYSYDDMNIYHREKLYALNYVIPLIATIVQYYYLAKEKIKLSKTLVISLILYFALPVIGAIVQLFVQGLTLSNMLMGGVAVLLYLFTIYDANLQLKEKEKTEADLRLAKEIQQSEVPNVFPAFPGRDEFDLYAKMTPAKDVGGDFYDYFFIDDNHLGIVIADVSGKSISGSLNMIKAKVLLRNIALNNEDDPAAILFKLNNSFIDNNSLDMFVTMWFGIVEISTGKITFVNAGHDDAIIANDEVTDLHVSKHGVPIGAMRNYNYTNSVIQLHKGDKLFLYTDGITDLTNVNDEEYGINKLIRTIYSNREESVKDIIKAVDKELIKHADGNEQFDDITMLCFELTNDNKRNKNIMEVERKYKANLKEVVNVYDYFSPMISKVLSPDKTKQYNVVVDEIFSNIVKYGFKDKNKDNYINIKLIIDSKTKTIKMIFEDEGIKFNPLDKEDPNISASLDNRDEGGLGIFIVKKMMDNVSYEYKDNKNILIIEKKY